MQHQVFKMRKDTTTFLHHMFVLLMFLSSFSFFMMFSYLQFDLGNKVPFMMRYSNNKIRQFGDTLRNTFNNRPVLGVLQEKCSTPFADVNSTLKVNPLFDNFTMHSLDLNKGWQTPSKVIYTQSIYDSPSFTLFKARIPAIVYHRDIFFVFCEARLEGSQDYGRMKLVLRRGIRQGLEVEWERFQVIASLPYVRTMNPSPVVDKQRDVILVVFSTFPTDMDFRQMLEFQGKQLSDVYVVKSYDLGLSWTDPVSITHSTIARLEPFPTLFVPGPGHSIQLSCGRIIVPGNYFQVDRYSREYPHLCRNCTNYCNIFYSDDGGVSWHAGGSTPYTEDQQGIPIQPNEVQAVELNNGAVCINSRTIDADHTRSQAYSFDAGVTLSKPLLTSVFEPGYKKKKNKWHRASAGGCAAGLVRFPAPNSNPVNPTYWMIMSNPAHRMTRKFLSVRLSKDDCSTWSEPWIFHEDLAGYSDITTFELTINHRKFTFFAVVYEGGTVNYQQHMLFKMFNLEAVVKGMHDSNRPTER
ncbi:sialidase-3-like [Antedon mediterranea]|uniref:sialidase-3-like n=1 Tax=Antedon mediterranea TaxID=105859 RepID=UPI003AF50F68